MNRFELATIMTAAGPGAAIFVDDRYFLLSELMPFAPAVQIIDLLRNWEEASRVLERLAEGISGGEYAEVRPLENPQLLTPIRYPDKLLAVGANYPGHLVEMGLASGKWASMPFFLRPPTTTLVGPGRTVHIPASTRQFDWECELTMVVGRRLKNATREEAGAAIAGYTIGLDMSCRDLIPTNDDLHIDLVRGKAQDTMAPCGPHFVPAAYIGDVNNLPVKLWVNDVLMIDASTAQMLFKPDEMLAVISRFVTLEPGDMVMTGSPPGSAGVHGDAWLKPGDRIRATIGDIPALEVSCEAAEVCADTLQSA